MSRVANATILQVEVPAAEGPADFQFGPVSGYVFRKDGKLYVPFIVSSNRVREASQMPQSC